MCMLLFFPAGQRLQEVDFQLENEVLEQHVFVLVCWGCSLRDVQAEFCHEEVLNIMCLVRAGRCRLGEDLGRLSVWRFKWQLALLRLPL
jgi:hypothetical protein